MFPISRDLLGALDPGLLGCLQHSRKEWQFWLTRGEKSEEEMKQWGRAGILNHPCPLRVLPGGNTRGDGAGDAPGGSSFDGRGWQSCPQPPSSPHWCRLGDKDRQVTESCPAQNSPLVFPVMLGQGMCFGVQIQPWGPCEQSGDSHHPCHLLPAPRPS